MSKQIADMTNTKDQLDQTVTFLGEGTRAAPSTFHRCIMVTDELQKHGINAEVLLTSSNLRFLKHFTVPYAIADWRKIIAGPPAFLIIHRCSSYIDYEMLKKLQRNSACTIIFDYDDALFHARFRSRLLSYARLAQIMTLCDAVTAGSHYLKEYASRFNSNTYLLPTSVDTELFHPKNGGGHNTSQITIGWLGSGDAYQLRYLKILKTPLDVLSRKYDIEFRIVSAFSKAVKREFSHRGYAVDFGFDHWVPIQEAARTINDFDIGVMPLVDSPWERGKCSMKALEYMASGLPVVASPVGENNFVIKHGYNGFLAKNEKEWVDCLERLILDKQLAMKIGVQGRKFVEQSYSLPKIADKLIDIIEEQSTTL